MSNFLVKTAALAFICCNASLLFSATNEVANAAGGMEEIHLQVPSASLPFQACVLDFSDRDAAAVSALKLTTLFLANEEKLTPLFVTYLIFEILVAESRALPDSLGAVSQALNTKTSENRNALYEAFQKVQGTINTAKDLNAIFLNKQTCTTFVTTEFTQDLPKLLVGMEITGIEASLITAAVAPFVPTISDMLFNAYGAMHVVGGKAVAKFKNASAGWCSSFVCCGGSTQQVVDPKDTKGVHTAVSTTEKK